MKESEVELFRWELAQGKGDDKGVDDGARLSAEIAVQGEGHAIGAARGILGPFEEFGHFGE